MGRKQDLFFESLRRFRQKDFVPVERFGNGVGSGPFDGIGGGRGENHGIFGCKHSDKLGNFFGVNEGAYAIVNQNVSNGIGQTLQGVKDRFLAGFAAGDEFHPSKFLQRRRQKFCRPFFLSGRDGKNDFGNAFDLGKFFKGIGQKRLAVDFDELFWSFAAGAFAFPGGDKDQTNLHQ